MKSLSTAAAVLALLLPGAVEARAEIAVFIQPGAFDDVFPAAGSMHGWQFSVTVPIEVTHLGLYDEFLNGFLQPHPIGIWDGGGTLLAEELISAGTLNPLIDNFRYVEIGGSTDGTFTLSPGEQYTIGFYSAQTLQGEGMVIFDGSHVFNPVIDYVGAGVADLTGEFAMPVTLDPNGTHRFGPNFQFTIVPAPAPLALLVVVLAVARRVRRG